MYCVEAFALMIVARVNKFNGFAFKYHSLLRLAYRNPIPFSCTLKECTAFYSVAPIRHSHVACFPPYFDRSYQSKR